MNLDLFYFSTFKDLYLSNCIDIPDEKGIYVVIAPNQFYVNFLDSTTAIKYFKGKKLLYSSSDLKVKYDKTDKNILYIGKASGKHNNLRRRIMQYVKYGYGKANNHRGGRAIWQIENNKNLRIGYFKCDDPDELERDLLNEYYNQCCSLPLANWRLENRKVHVNDNNRILSVQLNIYEDFKVIVDTENKLVTYNNLKGGYETISDRVIAMDDITIEKFHSKMENIRFLKWEREYFAPILDGTSWSVNIITVSELFESRGSNDFPEDWDDFYSIIYDTVRERL